MNFFNKTFFIKLRLRHLMIFFICVALLFTGLVLYKTYTLHDLLLRCLLTENSIESIYIYNRFGQNPTPLEKHQIALLIPLLQNLRITEEPYTDFGILGDHGNDFQIHLKNGIVLELNIYCGEPACFIINGMGYPVSDDGLDNLRQLEAFYLSCSKTIA